MKRFPSTSCFCYKEGWIWPGMCFRGNFLFQMAEITAGLVKELRERTGAGMMECKKALVESNGDIELAIDNMRKSGQAKAAKKAGRVAAEGIILAKIASCGNCCSCSFHHRRISALYGIMFSSEIILSKKSIYI